MSYRSFKRVLGESNIERKCRWLFGGCLFILITGSFWWYGKQTDELVFRQNRTKGRLLVDTVMALLHWEKLKSDDAHAEFDSLLQELSTELQDQEYTWKVLHVEPTDASAGPQDEKDWEVLERFVDTLPPTPNETGEPTEFDERLLVDSAEYEYYQPIRAKKMCTIVCHTTPPKDAAAALAVAGTGMPLEDFEPVRWIMKVKFPIRDTQGALSWNRAILWAIAAVTFFLAMVTAYFIVRYVIVKPLRHLRDVSDDISRGNIDCRADIHTGDEFEELGVAFNRMLRHLVAAQQELQQVNGELDSKVDELAQVNMRLFEMNRLKSDFLATMSHELRTPLNSIIGFSDVLSSISSLDEKQGRYVKNIQKSGKMLLDMINDILDLAKIEAGKAEVRLSNFRIEHVVVAQCDMARPLTERKNLDLDIDLPTDFPELYQDQGKVQQILNNLLSNAIKFTPDGGRIQVAARLATDDQFELIIADTGVGISDEDRHTIFEKFRQGKIVLPSGDAMTREYSGTGLGLSIVKELCKLLGGEISLESELGKGSTFTVRLPIQLADRPGMLDVPLHANLDPLPLPTRFESALPHS
jgi:signal transduction histidine kinase